MAVLLGFDRISPDVRMMIARMIELEWRITVSGSRVSRTEPPLVGNVLSKHAILRCFQFYKHKKERYEVISLAELQILAPTVSRLSHPLSSGWMHSLLQLDWQLFLSTLTGEQLHANEKIALKTGREWLIKLSQIVFQYMETTAGQAVVRNYIKWKTLFFHLAYVKPKCHEGYLWVCSSE